jgi:hypothetical protein
VDDNTEPYNLFIPSHGRRRFCYRRSPADIDLTGCYPFHIACWTLLQEGSSIATTGNDIRSLFNVFESFHYNRKSRCLKWGHNYYLEDMLGKEKQQSSEADIVGINKGDPTLLADPLDYVPSNRQIQSHQTSLELRKQEPRNRHPLVGSRLLLLPQEVLQLIVRNLEYYDVQSLILDIGEKSVALSSWFWISRFSGQGEAAFALPIRPPEYSLEAWFFTLKLQMEHGPSRTNLLNRRRISKLGVELCSIVMAMNEPGRILRGNVVTSLRNQQRGSVSCLALEHDVEGCRELKQICVNFGNQPTGSRLCAVLPTYTLISNRRLISGLTFIFDDGRSVDAGYVTNRHNGCEDLGVSPKFLFVVCSPLGLEAISVDVYPRRRICQLKSVHGSSGVARWPIQSLSGISLGLDVCLPFFYFITQL